MLLLFSNSALYLFTDELRLAHKPPLECVHGSSDISLTWTANLLRTFSKAYGYCLLDRPLDFL